MLEPLAVCVSALASVRVASVRLEEGQLGACQLWWRTLPGHDALSGEHPPDGSLQRDARGDVRTAKRLKVAEKVVPTHELLSTDFCVADDRAV
eukprot:2291462-Rhodomonas_salina.1